MSRASVEESAESSETSLNNLDIVKRQITSAWFLEIKMKTKSVICPLTADSINLSNNRLPFYCVHSISGAGGAELRHLATYLTSEQPLIAIQAPMGRRNKKSVQSPDSLAKYYCSKLLSFHEPRYGNSPFILGGWSAGAVIALEMAQQLARAGHTPALLVAIDKAPRNTKAEIDPLRNSHFRNLYLWLRLTWRKSATFHELIGDLLRKASWCLQSRRIYGSPFTEVDKLHQIHKLIEGARSDDEKEFIASLYEELENYVPLPYAGNVLVLMTREGYGDRVAEGWKAIAKHPKIVKVPGTHTSIIDGMMTNGVVDLGDVRSLAEALHWELAPDQFQQRGTRISDRGVTQGAPLIGLEQLPCAADWWA